MVRYIKKRDENIVPFEKKKIAQAIKKALKATDTDESFAENLTDKVESIILITHKDNVPTVENIQDLVEHILVNEGFTAAAKAYIIYREQHAQLRDTNEILSQAINMIDNYLGEADWRVKENSNMGYSLQGLNNYISSQITASYWLNKIYNNRIKKAHEDGHFHIHDLGLLSVYCCGWDLLDLIGQGLGGVAGKVESGPPKHFQSALGQIINFFYTLQGEAAGAQAFSSFDTILAPFIKYDNLNYDQVKQAMQEFVFNVNIPTRVGFQTPFTNITMDLQAPVTLADMPVMLGGKPQKETYKEFQNEMDMLNKAFCEVMMEGDYKGRIFTFPIPTYNISSDFDWNNQNLDALWQMTSKYGVPYFSNFINSDMKPEDARSMCCRLRLDNRELRKRGGSLFASNPMTGSIGVVTINVPRLAYEAKGDLEKYYKSLDWILELAKESLLIKRKILERFTVSGLYPYSKHYLREIKASKGGYWVNHFNTVGVIGINEACQNMFGQETDISTEKGKQFAVDTLTYIRDRLIEFQEEDGSLYNLEATPGEGTSYRFARNDTELFPEIITSGTEEPYYTNSTHLPVDKTDDIFEALTHQDDLQTLYTGGTVLHGFLGENIEDIEQCKKLVKRIAEKFRLPYFTITPTFTICPVHGYIRGEHHSCPVKETKAS
ncbi:ribonucleoside triphosphate reductase [Candidatus Margulisiibacteriota bacterium]